MRDLTKKQKQLLLKWAKDNPDLALKANPAGEMDIKLYDEINSINPCEIFYQNANHFIYDLTENDKIDIGNTAIKKAIIRRAKEQRERIKNRPFIEWIDVYVIDEILRQSLENTGFKATEVNKKELWLKVLESLFELVKNKAERLKEI